MRWLLGTLVMLAILLQAQLWLGDDGYRKTRSLHRAVQAQTEQNDELRARNAALDAEVMNLKTGKAAAEERARSDLGLIGANETFYQVVPVSDPAP